MRANPVETPEDPGRAIEGYRGAQRRLVVRVAVSGVGPLASGLTLALLATSALIAAAFGVATG
ncbi:MAG: hypothetical protein U5L06_08325 [Rhodovibrio sp.]|nr:hypothetical protein [Rhodovibrio sp.]